MRINCCSKNNWWNLAILKKSYLLLKWFIKVFKIKPQKNYYSDIWKTKVTLIEENFCKNSNNFMPAIKQLNQTFVKTSTYAFVILKITAKIRIDDFGITKADLFNSIQHNYCFWSFDVIKTCGFISPRQAHKTIQKVHQFCCFAAWLSVYIFHLMCRMFCQNVKKTSTSLQAWKQSLCKCCQSVLQYFFRVDLQKWSFLKKASKDAFIWHKHDTFFWAWLRSRTYASH